MAASEMVIVVLAAGQSKRLRGQLKQLLPFPYRKKLVPLVRVACANALEATPAVVLVVGYRAAEVAAAVRRLPIQIVANPDFSAGQSTSVRAGLAAALQRWPEAAAVGFLPCDQPLVTPALLHRMAQTVAGHPGGAIAVPTFQGRRGAPVLFSRGFFPELAAITGDEGGRQVIRQHPEAVLPVELEDEGPLLDADTRESYLALVDRLRPD
jgi:molybdenum cofactor cytidylyltransferase